MVVITPGATEGAGAEEAAQQLKGPDLSATPALAQPDKNAVGSAVQPILDNQRTETHGALLWVAHSFKADEQGKPVFTPSVLSQETERMRTNENSNSTEKALGYDFETASIQYQLSNLSLDIERYEFFMADNRVLPYQKAEYRRLLDQAGTKQRALSDRLKQLQEERKADSNLTSEPNQVKVLAKKLGITDAEIENNPLAAILKVLNENNSEQTMNQLLSSEGNQFTPDEKKQLLLLAEFISGKQDKKNFLSAMGGGIFSLLLIFLMKKMLEGGQRQQ